MNAHGSNLSDLLDDFKNACSDELIAAMFSALQLLSPNPLDFSHCLVIALEYDPTNSDPSLPLHVREAYLSTPSPKSKTPSPRALTPRGP